jgi:murein DD-endopeptidase MepM/ murein hydrolase activator NlpD
MSSDNLLALLLGSVIVSYGVSSCGTSDLRTATPPNAPPDISVQMTRDSPSHRGISIGGYRYFGHEIIAPADGAVVFVRSTHVRIYHGTDSNNQEIYTEHYHLHGDSLTQGEKIKRGQTIGSIGSGLRSRIPHYHYLVVKEERPGQFIALQPSDYWFGIDEYKANLDKGFNLGPFAIACFNPSLNYPDKPIRFTYPVKCK